MKRALITGITGQDGSYLAEHLLELGYQVHGIIRRSSSFNTARIDHLIRENRLQLHYGDVTDANSVNSAFAKALPHEVYHLAAQSHVRVSFDLPEFTFSSIASGTLNVLEAARRHREESGLAVRLYNASSSEQFGGSDGAIDESTPFHPRSPYAVAKCAAHNLVSLYRETHGLFAASGILFNHESPRRGETFVTRKITRAATRIKLGLQSELVLGNLNAVRDWGFAGEYVRAMHSILQLDRPGDHIVATGTTWSVRQFVESAFTMLELDWKEHVRYSAVYERPNEVHRLEGNASMSRETFGWKPQVHTDALVRMMVESDLRLAEQERHLQDAGLAPLPQP